MSFINEKRNTVALAVMIGLLSTGLLLGCRGENNPRCPRFADDDFLDDELEDTDSGGILPILPDPTLPFVPTNVGSISLAGITGDLTFDGLQRRRPGRERRQGPLQQH